MTKNNLAGQLLVANPLNPKDGLDHSVVLVVSHTPGVSLGLRLNSPAKTMPLSKIFNQIGLHYESNDCLYHSGNLTTDKVHLVHSLDWQGLTTVELTPTIGITNDISVLAAIARGEGPEYFRACAGVLSWVDGGLDQQLNHKTDTEYKWELATANIETVFGADELDQWHKCIEASARDQVSKWFNLFQG